MFDDTGFGSGDHLDGYRGTFEGDLKAVARLMSDQLRPLVPPHSHLSAFCCGIVVGLDGKPVQVGSCLRREQFAFAIGRGIEFLRHRMSNDGTRLPRPRFIEQPLDAVGIELLSEGRWVHPFEVVLPGELSALDALVNLLGDIKRRRPPRDGRYPKRGSIDPGAFRTKRLRRLPYIEIFKWNSILDRIRAESESARPKRDRMRLAFQYQELLDSGVVETRAELAHHLGVSRARVTQVLNRLKSSPD